MAPNGPVQPPAGNAADAQPVGSTENGAVHDRSLSRLSMRAQLLVGALSLVVLALVMGGAGFFLASKQVVSGIVADELRSRAHALLESVGRYELERALGVETWAQTEAMQTTLDSGDPKFAEDYFLRTIQSRPGAFALVLLADAEGKVLTAVRDAAAGAARGEVIEKLRGTHLSKSMIAAAQGNARDRFAPASDELRSSVALEEDSGMTIVAPVRDFAGDLVGLVLAIPSRVGFERLLAESVGGTNGKLIPLLFDSSQQQVFGLPGTASGPLLTHVLATPPGQKVPQGAGLDSPHWALTDRTARWSTVVLVSDAMAFGPLSQLRQTMTWVLVGLTGFAVWLGSWVLRKLTQPLGELAHSMAKVSQGDLTIRLPPQRPSDLSRLVTTFNTMVEEVGRARTQAAKLEVMRREVEIAREIQLSILPKQAVFPGFEVAARSRPAAEVGGDFYDLISVGDSFWLVIGDVSGHGLNAGMVMLMAQAAAHAGIAARPEASPADIVSDVNRVIYENVRRRMSGQDYVTMMAARHLGGGSFVAAGSHQPLFLARQSGKVDVVNNGGPWVGLAREIRPAVQEVRFSLSDAESLVLITDGIVEAKSATGEYFGEERITARAARFARISAEEALGDVFSTLEGFCPDPQDDVTAVVLKRRSSMNV